MRTRTSTWKEVTVSFNKVMDNGLQKVVSEKNVVDAITFGEGETSIYEQLKGFYGDIKIKTITPASYKEVWFSDESNDEKWYKAKLQFITIDEKTEREKRQNVLYLVQAANIRKAIGYIDNVMSNTMIDYAIVSVAETNIVDVYEHENNDK